MDWRKYLCIQYYTFYSKPMYSRLSGKFRRITTNQLYLPEIDGIRFLAVSLVILYHIYQYFITHTSIATTAGNGNHPLLHNFVNNSDRGVEMFFVLSGFVLCMPFAQYYLAEGNKVSLPHYYMRRATRLEPPYFIAITGIFCLQLLFNTRVFNDSWPGWLASMGYSHLLVFNEMPTVSVVTWSLEIEIQFYLLAPLLFRVLSLAHVMRRLLLCGAVVAAVLLQHFFPLNVITLHGYIQYFLVGILLADYYVTNHFAALFSRKFMVPAAVAAFVILMALPVKPGSAGYYYLLGGRILLPFVIFVFYYAVFKNKWLISSFSLGLIPVIGGMCYSVYLLHYTVIGIAGRLTTPILLTGHYIPNFLLQVVLFTVPILLVSAAFYYFVERPFMSRKWVDLLLSKVRKPIFIFNKSAE